MILERIIQAARFLDPESMLGPADCDASGHRPGHPGLATRLQRFAATRPKLCPAAN